MYKLGLMAAALALGVACGDNFRAVQDADTIAAYEAYLANNPDGRFQIEAESRLEQLVLERAREEKTLEAFDIYLERFPEGVLREEALVERESFLFAWAQAENTAASWTTFLDEYPRAKKDRRSLAKRMVKVHGYLEHLELSPTRMKQVNLAEDPEGPLDGWGFEVDVTNNGPTTITELRLTIQFLSPEGGTIDKREWPMVAEFWKVPVEEERKVPMKAGETRTWEWSTGDVPERWDRQTRVFVSRIHFAGEATK